MASVKITSFSLLFAVVILSLLPTQNAKAKHENLTGNNPFCKPSDDMQLCNQIVKNAKNLHDASVNAINAAISIAKRIQNLVPSVVHAVADLPPNTRDELIKICTETFENSVDDLQKALECYNKGDKGGADSNLSAAFRGECTDALKEEGESVPMLTQLNSQFYKVVDNALAVVFQRYAGVMWGGP